MNEPPRARIAGLAGRLVLGVLITIQVTACLVVSPIDRLESAQTMLTYVYEDERVSMPFTPKNLQATAELWTEDMVRKWFGIDNSKVFFYVPQVAAYQGVVEVHKSDVDLAGSE